MSNQKSVQDVLREEFEKTLLDVIMNGGAVIKDDEGRTIMDGDRPAREPCPAAYLAVARTYLKDARELPANTGEAAGVLAKYQRMLENKRKRHAVQTEEGVKH